MPRIPNLGEQDLGRVASEEKRRLQLWAKASLSLSGPLLGPFLGPLLGARCTSMKVPGDSTGRSRLILGRCLQTTNLPGCPVGHPTALGKGTKPTCVQGTSQELWGGQNLTQLRAREGGTAHRCPGLQTASGRHCGSCTIPAASPMHIGARKCSAWQQTHLFPGHLLTAERCTSTVSTAGLTDGPQVSNSSC